MPRYISRRSKKSTKKHRKSSKHKKNHSKKHTKNHQKNRSNNHRQRGGAADCNLATVREPGFNVPALGDITGLSIPESRSVIYRPNCQPDTYQAMTP